MFKYFCAIVFFSFTLTASAQDSDILPSPGFHEVIPYEDVLGKILIPVRIGDQTFKFMFDTGGRLILSKRVIELCQLTKKGSVNVSGVNKTSSSANIVSVPLVCIGKLKYQNFDGIVLDLFDRSPADCYGADGLIGRDFLKQVIVQMDQENLELILTDQLDQLDLSSAAVTPLYIHKRKGNMPNIRVKINDKKTHELTFDSGSSKLLSLQTKFAQKLLKKKKYKRMAIVLHGVQSLGASGIIPEPHDSYQVKMDKIQFGEIILSDFYTDPSLHSRSRIGTGLLDYGIITLDYIHGNFYFKSNQNSTSIQVKSIATFGFSTSFDNSSLYVSAIQTGSQAEQLGLSIGDQIISMNRVRYDSLTPLQYCEYYLRSDEKREYDTMELSYKTSSGSIKTITIDKTFK